MRCNKSQYTARCTCSYLRISTFLKNSLQLPLNHHSLNFLCNWLWTALFGHLLNPTFLSRTCIQVPHFTTSCCSLFRSNICKREGLNPKIEKKKKSLVILHDIMFPNEMYFCAKHYDQAEQVFLRWEDFEWVSFFCHASFIFLLWYKKS